MAWPAPLRRDEMAFALPIAHIMGFAVLMGAACCGIPVYLLPHFRPVEVLDAIESRRATIFVGVPAMYRLMLEAGAADRDLTSVRVWGSGADAMPGELARTFKGFGATASLPLVGPVGEAAFFEGYGMVEVGGGVAAKVSPPMMGLGLGESVGFQLPGYRFRVVDDEGDDVRTGGTGELWVHGPGVIKGYWNAPEVSAATVTEEGWLRTGDLVRKGPMGTVLFVGREKDVIKHGGYSVYALEVQEAIERHPEVAEVAGAGPGRRAQGRDPGRGGAPATGLHAVDRGPGAVDRGPPGRLQGAPALGAGRRAAPHRHQQGAEGRAGRPVLLIAPMIPESGASGDGSGDERICAPSVTARSPRS